jgi:hypothetical protein
MLGASQSRSLLRQQRRRERGRSPHQPLTRLPAFSNALRSVPFGEKIHGTRGRTHSSGKRDALDSTNTFGFRFVLSLSSRTFAELYGGSPGGRVKVAGQSCGA